MMAMVTSVAGSLPVREHQRPRVAQAASPLTPSLVRYTPVAPDVSAASDLGGVAVGVHEGAALFVGDSSQCATRMPRRPSLSSLKDDAVERLESDDQIDARAGIAALGRRCSGWFD